MIVKICGITCLDDALAAREAGADLLGYNFYPASPRSIRPAECARLQASLQDRGLRARTVGVFVNAPPADIQQVVAECGLDFAQLSGDEPPETLSALDRVLPGQVFKAIRPASLADAQAAARHYLPASGDPAAPALLIDAYHPVLYGGTGQTGDWQIAAGLAAQVQLLLAGGLHAGNVARALAQVHPWGVDVASGVESAPGRKDAHKMAAFVRAVRQFQQEMMQC